MKILENHYLLHKYIDDFSLKDSLSDFEIMSKFIYFSGMPERKRTLVYDEFNSMLREKGHPDLGLAALFADLKPDEKHKICDELFEHAIQPVVNLWIKVCEEHLLKSQLAIEDGDPPPNTHAIKAAYETITDVNDKYTLRSYVTDIAGWSDAAISLYDLGNAHVVFENGFESLKDSFFQAILEELGPT